MRFLHSRRLIHRDLKSPDVLLDGGRAGNMQRAKIGDLGTSRVVQQKDELVKQSLTEATLEDMLSLSTTMTGNTGTVNWMAPEVLANTHGGRPTSSASTASPQTCTASPSSSGK